MADKIPHNALVVVVDGAGARFFRNSGDENRVSLSAEGEFRPTNLLDDGPAGKRPKESTNQETDEATFAKQLVNELYRRAHPGDFAALVLIADPQTLGQIRPTLRGEQASLRLVWSALPSLLRFQHQPPTAMLSYTPTPCRTR